VVLVEVLHPPGCPNPVNMGGGFTWTTMMRKVGMRQTFFMSASTPFSEGASRLCRACQRLGQLGSRARNRLSKPMRMLRQATVKKAKRHPSTPATRRWPARQSTSCISYVCHYWGGWFHA
jgi:hypothetical protein